MVIRLNSHSQFDTLAETKALGEVRIMHVWSQRTHIWDRWPFDVHLSTCDLKYSRVRLRMFEEVVLIHLFGAHEDDII